MPINNIDNIKEVFNVAAGKHWTLLIYEKKTNKFIYFDDGTIENNDGKLTNSDSGQIINIKEKIYTVAKRVKSLCKND